jgi:acyl dehydratase
MKPSWHEILPGTALPPLERTTTFAHWNRYAAVNDEFIPMHMDPDEGRAAGQRDAFGMGNLRIAYLHDQLRSWLGDAGDIVEFACQFRGFNFKGDRLRTRAVVDAKEERDGAHLVHLVLGVDNQDGLDTTPGTATVLLFESARASTLPERGGTEAPPRREASEYVPQQVIDLLGETPPPLESYPVGANEIRRWAQAVYYPDPAPAVFMDEAVATRGPWGGMVAPREFNPFAWMPGAAPGRHWDLLRAKRPTALNGGQRFSYHAPIRPGDVVTRTARFADVYEKQGRSGTMVFVIGETRWTNQQGELVRRGRNTLILTGAAP